jgi:type VII secretion-associated serine protease mycosin
VRGKQIPSALALFLATLCAVAAAPAPAQAARLACGKDIPDPLAEPPWALTRLRPEAAWPLSTGAGVTVAVIDSGVSDNHPVLAGKVRTGKDFVLPGGGPGTCDENGHGTLIAGIIAGREATSGGFRFHGIAPGASIVPVRVLRDQRRSEESDLSDRIATAVRWAVDVGDAGVLNLSLTTPDTPELAAAVRHALDRGVVVVAAAGNDGEAADGQPAYPAAYPGVVAVAGVDDKDVHVSSSSEGDDVDVSAPGTRIAGPAAAGGGYVFTADGGTSFAAAYVSGVAALIRAYEPALRPEQVARRITDTADHPADQWNRQVGYGVVNPARAVGALRPVGGSAPAGAVVRVEPVPAAADPLRVVRAGAPWIAVTGIAAALLVLLAVPVVRRGRRRGWRTFR